MHNPIGSSDESMRDRLPEFVIGTLTAAESAAVSSHLTGCAECARDVQLIRLAGAAYPMPTLDIAAIIAALPTASRQAPRLSVTVGGASAMRLRLLRRPWRLAAAVSFIVLGGISLATLRGVMWQSAPADFQAAAVDSSLPVTAGGAAPLAAEPSETIEGSNASSRGTRVAASGLSIGAAADLSDAQLQRLLSELETVQAVPSIELAPNHHPMNAPDSPEDQF